MKKSMKKFMIACAAVSAMALAAGMSAMAADITSNYDAADMSVPINTPADAADGTQMTVLVIPTAKKASVTDQDILYIAQNAKGELPAAAKLMSSRVADGDYSLLVGYYNSENVFSIAEDTFTIGAAEPDYLLGDVNEDEWIDSNDAYLDLMYEIGEVDFTDKQFLAGDVNKDEWIDSNDAYMILMYEIGEMDW